MDDLAFSSRFRLTKESTVYVLEQIEEQIETVTDRNHSVAPIDQLLMTLRFYASGSFLISIGDFMNVSKSTCCRIINKVTRAIASLSPDFIKMPSTEEAISATHVHFYNIARLPRIVGSLDCTHIRISSPVRRTRNPVERSYGTWKRRFPVLALGLRLKLDTSLAVIVACGVLNNIAIQHKENLPPDDEYVLNDVDMDEDFELDPLPQHYAYTAKDELLANYFPQLLEGLNLNS
nr:unnamed protein product [Callosobruchus analis]